jgi:hypothetical protein
VFVLVGQRSSSAVKSDTSLISSSMLVQPTWSLKGEEERCRMTQDLFWYSLDDDDDGGICALHAHKPAVQQGKKQTYKQDGQTDGSGIRQSSGCVFALRSSALLGTR